ncbi:MAG: hypothetical protein K2K94_02990 [Muribaculaceae bacterium]|nr:hypothetical protein [Muribaculaceae bacterium]
MKISKLLFGIIALQILGASSIYAQNGTMTPYSRYGYGILSDNASGAQRTMGGVGYAMNSGRQINVMNPASYAAIDSLTFLFDMGFDLTNLWQKETVDGSVLSDQQTGAGLSYITMQFPIGRRMGMSVGLLPYSSVGYAFGSDIDNGSTSRQGSGSINELYVGVAGRLFKGLSLGVNVAYMFGTTFNDSYAYTNTGSTTLFERELEVADWRVDIGLQYNFSVSPKNRFNLGVVYSPKKDFHGNAITYAYDVNQEASPVESDKMKLAGNFSMAETWGAGIGWEWDKRLYTEVDFTYQPWSKTKYQGVMQDGADAQLNDRYKVAVGAQFTPKLRGNYFESIQYRVGGFYNRDYLRVMGNDVKEYGATVGFGLPVPALKTIINVGLEWKHRQANPNPLIKENYLSVTFGFNINELWFRPSKIY